MPSSIRREASDRLRDLRIKQGKTQREFAEILGVSPNHLYRIESGERDATLEMIERVADEFGLSIAYLLGLSDDKVHVESNGEVGVRTNEDGQAAACLRCGEDRFSAEWRYCWNCGFPLFNLCLSNRHVNPPHASHCVMCGDKTFWSLSDEERRVAVVEPESHNAGIPAGPPDKT